MAEVTGPGVAGLSSPPGTLVDDDDWQVAGDCAPCSVGIWSSSSTRIYLDALFGGHAGMAIMAIGSGPFVDDRGKYRHRRWRETAYAWPEQADELEDIIIREGDKADVYLCTLLMLGIKRRPDAVVHRDLLHADGDAADLDLGVISELGAFVVASGSDGHAHVYVPLSESVTAWQYEVLERGLVGLLGADHKIAANDVLRPPGTFNFKPTVMNGGGAPPVVVQWLVRPTGVRKSPSEVAALLGVSLIDTGGEGGHRRSGVRGVAIREPAEIADLDTHYPQIAEALGRNTGDRSVDTMRVVAACRDAGLDLEQTRQVVDRRPDLVERLDGRNDDDVARCWERTDRDGGVRLEDAYIGERLASRHPEFVYTMGMGWVMFDGRRWKPVSANAVAEMVRHELIAMWESDARAGAEPARLQQMSRMLTAGKIKAITYIVELCLTTDRQFDNHPHLLNVANGVVDLRTGALGPHDPDLMLTKLCPTNYLPDATHPDWDAALRAVHEEVAPWMQVRFGQGITGHPTPDDRLPVLQGGGANGKSCLLDGIRCSLGSDYAVAMPERVLLARHGDHPTELMTLRGARLAFAEELPEVGHLNVKRIKDLLGTGEITARYCGKDSVSWSPTHTPVVTTNYLPRVDESDNGTWRRLVMIQFPHTFLPPGTGLQTPQDRCGDPGLRERLRDGTGGRHEAVLAWLIEGAVRWYQDDRRMPEDPPSVQQATQAWRRTADVLLRYIHDRLVFDAGAQVMATELFEDFRDWLGTSGHTPWSDQTFSMRFAQHGEVLANQVENKRVRKSATVRLSQRPRRSGLEPPLAPAPPTQFKAWVGVRFKTAADDGDDQE